MISLFKASLAKLLIILLVSVVQTHAEDDLFGQDFISMQSNTKPQYQINSLEQLNGALKTILEQQKKIQARDRLELNRKLNSCTPSRSGSALIIAFSGTASHQPHLPPLMNKACKSLRSKMSPELIKNFYYHTHNSLYKSDSNLAPKWSGLLAGPMNLLCNRPELLPNSYDWYSFPSEETELLDHPATLEWAKLSRLPSEINKSLQSNPIGIQDALTCTQNFLKRSVSNADKPKLIVISHSSGGRSAIKYLEKLKTLKNPLSLKNDIKADLVFTIDPVKEAHEALLEIAQKAAQIPANFLRNQIPLIPDAKLEKPYIASKLQKTALYKTSNTKRHINVYQTCDKEGIKMIPQFAIHGSPIYQADLNLNLSSKLKGDAHGKINIHPSTLDLFTKELLRLYR